MYGNPACGAALGADSGPSGEAVAFAQRILVRLAQACGVPPPRPCGVPSRAARPDPCRPGRITTDGVAAVAGCDRFDSAETQPEENPMKRLTVAALLAFALAGPSFAQATAAPSQVMAANALKITAEVVAFDATTRAITLKGPFGGLIDAVVTEEVKDVSGIKPGAMFHVSFYNAVAASIHRKGDAQPLFTASDIAAKAEPGKAPKATSVVTESFTVFSVDVANNAVVLKDKEGTLDAIDVVRPEFQAKLKDLKAGDQIDMTYSAAMVTSLTPVTPGQEAKATMTEGTLIIERGEVVKRMNNVLMIRNERGRMLRVVVPTDFKFSIDGREMSVIDLKEGTKLTRTAIRVKEVVYTD
jgi:hypothetical protein